MEKKIYNISGMACGHCRKAVEDALNSIDGITAEVTLEPPSVIIEFAGNELSIAELQEIIFAEAGEYIITKNEKINISKDSHD